MVQIRPMVSWRLFRQCPSLKQSGLRFPACTCAHVMFDEINGNWAYDLICLWPYMLHITIWSVDQRSSMFNEVYSLIGRPYLDYRIMNNVFFFREFVFHNFRASRCMAGLLIWFCFRFFADARSAPKENCFIFREMEI